jgi:hypothetical protein
MILELTTDSYPSKTPIYTDASFVADISTQRPAERAIELPSTREIIGNMRLQNGKRYIW